MRRHRQKTRSNRGKKGKREFQEKHFGRRLAVRFRQNLTSEEIQQIIKDIQAGKSKFVVRQSNRISIFEVNIRDECRVWVVYDRSQKTLVTALYPDEKDTNLNSLMEVNPLSLENSSMKTLDRDML